MRIMLLPVAMLLAPAVAFGQASPNDVDYCNRLADLYVHYIGRSESSPYDDVVRGSNDTQVAAAQCESWFASRNFLNRKEKRVVKCWNYACLDAN